MAAASGLYLEGMMPFIVFPSGTFLRLVNDRGLGSAVS